ncbi:hypothetical protein [Croceibacterium mercuriale]|uniref:hypothetical protein n=1 Tax=Croceibacterium mercuriale TaxID=1572751 RepID=UPI00126A022F|nr:hypothetical protein [Croceibacterium mercuriale]
MVLVTTDTSGGNPTAVRDLFAAGPLPTTAKGRMLWYVRQPFILPSRSLLGSRRIRSHVDRNTTPASWREDFSCRSTLVVGTGPSLDRVDQSFFARFQTIIYINFALQRATYQRPEYYFTTDIMPTRDIVVKMGPACLTQLGRDRCIFAPFFLDQWYLLTPEGRELFTWLSSDSSCWTGQTFKTLPLPLIWRYSPRQPVWTSLKLPTAERTIPILRHTSALTAVLFAALQGSREIGLIGCDFSAGRAHSIAAAQPGATTNIFSEAIGELSAMTEALSWRGVTVTNHSWLV